MFNLLDSINLSENKYKYYYNTKLKDIHLLDFINLYLFYKNFIKQRLLKIPKQVIGYIKVKPYYNLNRIYIKSSIVVIGGLISALLYSRRKLYTCVIHLNNKREYLKLKSSNPSNINTLEGKETV